MGAVDIAEGSVGLAESIGTPALVESGHITVQGGMVAGGCYRVTWWSRLQELRRGPSQIYVEH